MSEQEKPLCAKCGLPEHFPVHRPQPDPNYHEYRPASPPAAPQIAGCLKCGEPIPGCFEFSKVDAFRCPSCDALFEYGQFVCHGSKREFLEAQAVSIGGPGGLGNTTGANTTSAPDNPSAPPAAPLSEWDMDIPRNNRFQGWKPEPPTAPRCTCYSDETIAGERFHEASCPLAAPDSPPACRCTHEKHEHRNGYGMCNGTFPRTTEDPAMCQCGEYNPKPPACPRLSARDIAAKIFNMNRTKFLTGQEAANALTEGTHLIEAFAAHRTAALEQEGQKWANKYADLRHDVAELCVANGLPIPESASSPAPAEARIAELEAALRKYGRHIFTCTAAGRYMKAERDERWVDGDETLCRCGLAAALGKGEK